jgi:hypothetical protein
MKSKSIQTKYANKSLQANYLTNQRRTSLPLGQSAFNIPCCGSAAIAVTHNRPEMPDIRNEYADLPISAA